MKRGIVMSIHKHHAVVMTADGQFLRAPATKNIRIGEEISFDDEYKQPRPFRNSYRFMGAAAIVLLIMLPLLLYIGRDAEPVVAYLSMDINPSIEIGVDSNEKTRELRALNPSGEKLIEGLEYDGLDVLEVTTAIVERARLEHYFDITATDVFIASVLMGEKTEALLQFETLLTKKVDDTVKEVLESFEDNSASLNVTTLSVPIEVRSAADANGVSAGKMTVYLMAKDEGYDLELEQLKTQSIDEATESLGGVKTLVGQTVTPDKEKLKQLAVEETKQQAQKTDQKQAEQTSTIKSEMAKQANLKLEEEKKIAAREQAKRDREKRLQTDKAQEKQNKAEKDKEKRERKEQRNGRNNQDQIEKSVQAESTSASNEKNSKRGNQPQNEKKQKTDETWDKNREERNDKKNSERSRDSGRDERGGNADKQGEDRNNDQKRSEGRENKHSNEESKNKNSSSRSESSNKNEDREKSNNNNRN